MKNLDTISIKPSDFKTSEHFWDSPFKDSDLETLAHNIIVMSKKNGDKWVPFTWEEYRLSCACCVSFSDLMTLRQRGYINCDGSERFSVNNNFIRALKDFLKPGVI